MTTHAPIRQQRLARIGALAVLAVCGVLNASHGIAAAPGSATIDIAKFSFSPKEITVAPGTTVQWVNHDEIPHTITSAQGQAKVLASKGLDTDDKYSFSFAKEGDYGYYCTVHPYMTGVVHVRGSSSN
jgi:plastocyanin